ncbi:hypothetical protein LTR94_037358, partial [Friedmanniomyces endolithicus]
QHRHCLQLHRRRAAAVRRRSRSRRTFAPERCPDRRGDRREGADPVDRDPGKGKGGGHLGQCRAAALSLGAVVLRGRLVAPARP